MKRQEIIKMLEKFEMIDVNGSVGIPPNQYNALAHEIEQLILNGVEYTVLVNYKQVVDSGHPRIEDTIELRTKIVKVKDLLELNELFRNITDVKILNCP